MTNNRLQEQNDLNRFANLIGFTFTHCQNGECGCELEVRDDLFHPGGVVHGGVAFAMADSTMAMALISGLDGGQGASTVECKISYLAAVTSGTLTAKSRVVKRGRRIAFLESEVRQGDKLIATATATFAIIEHREA